MCTFLLCGGVSWCIHAIYLTISFKVASLALVQTHGCPSASEVTLKDVAKIKWKGFPLYWLFVRGIHLPDYPYKGPPMSSFIFFLVGSLNSLNHYDVIRWKHFPHYWPFVRGIHRSTANSRHKGQWRGALMFSLICTETNGWANHRDAGDLRRHRAHYDVTVMTSWTNDKDVGDLRRHDVTSL